METKKRKKGYALGEAVRDKVTGQKMYVEVTWTPEVRCVYFDAEKKSLVKVEKYPEGFGADQGITTISTEVKR